MKTGGVPGTHCLHMRLISPRRGDSRILPLYVTSEFELNILKFRFSASNFSYPSATCGPKYGSQAGAKSKYQGIVYEGKDVFVWLPTGFGKSVCSEALPFVFDFKLRTNVSCLALVISLLISLLLCFYYLNFVKAHTPK